MLIQNYYSMRFVTVENYAIYKQKFEEKYGPLKSEKIDIFGNTKTSFYNEDLKWAFDKYIYGKAQQNPMPLFQELHSKDKSEHRYLMNDYLIHKEGYDIGFITEGGEKLNEIS